MISMILWEFLFSLFDSILLKKFCDLFLSEKKQSNLYQITAIVVLAVLIFVISYAPVFSYVSALVMFLLFIGYCVLIYHGKPLYKITIGILFQITYSIYSLAAVSLMSMILGDQASMIYEYNSLIRILFIVITRILLFMILEVVSFKKNKKIFRMMLPAMFVPGLCIGAAGLLLVVNLLYNNTLSTRENDIYILILGLVVFAILFVRMIKLFWEEKAKRKELETQKMVLEMQKEDYKNRAMQEQDIRKMKHDMKNNLLSIEALVKEKRYEEAEQYLTKLSNTSALKKMIDTGNPVIDGILNTKIQSCPDIKFHLDMNIEYCDIDYDIISTILGNAVDNAIEATKKNLEHNQDIFVHMNENHNRVLIEIENHYKDEPAIEEGHIITLKKDKANHGFGLHNIERAANQCDGQVNYDINKEEKIFKLSVLLMKE